MPSVNSVMSASTLDDLIRNNVEGIRSGRIKSFTIKTPSILGDVSAAFSDLNVDDDDVANFSSPPDLFHSVSSLSHLDTDAGYAESSVFSTNDFSPPFDVQDIAAHGVDVTDSGDGGVVKCVTKRGVGSTPEKGARVWIRYECFRDGKEEPYDSKFGSKTKPLLLGDGQILPGIEMAVLSMQMREEAIVVIHHDYAYGELGCLPVIPPSSTIVVCLQLVNFDANSSAANVEPNAESNSTDTTKSIKDKLREVIDLNRTCRQAYDKEDFFAALQLFKEAERKMFVPLENEEEFEYWMKIFSLTYALGAMVAAKCGRPALVCSICRELSRMPGASDEVMMKTYYRWGMALGELADKESAFDVAIQKLKKALGIAKTKNRKTIEKEIERLRAEKIAWTAQSAAGQMINPVAIDDADAAELNDTENAADQDNTAGFAELGSNTSG